jgi:Phosphomannomutase
LKIMLVNGWVLLRPSGTEPIIRIYGESRDEKTAKEIANDYKEMIEKLNRR